MRPATQHWYTSRAFLGKCANEPSPGGGSMSRLNCWSKRRTGSSLDSLLRELQVRRAAVVDTAQWLSTRVRLRACASVGRGTRAIGNVWVWGGGRIAVGRRVLLDASVVPIELHCFEGATLEIGDDVVIRGGTSIEAMCSVSIGARTCIDMFCKVMDNNFHSLTDHWARPPSHPVTIGEDVRLERHCMVVCANVGQGTLIAPRTVALRAVPASATMCGLPPVVRRRGLG